MTIEKNPDLQAFEARFAENQKITGYGLETTVHVPCPFCAAPDFLVHSILEVEEAYARGATCGECGRGMRALIKHDASAVQFDLVQTVGDDPPAWFGTAFRRVAEGGGS